MSKRIEIQYDGKVVQSIAMSKWPNQSGLILRVDGDRLKFNAINPKTGTQTSYLEMQAPVDKIDEIIDALKQLQNG